MKRSRLPDTPCPLGPSHKTAGYFTGKARYYARYRRGYPVGVFDRIIREFDLTPASEILDLGCGTGNVAIPLAERGLTVHAVDPEPEMLEEGKMRVPPVCPGRITWRVGADSTIATLGLPPLRLCTMGLSFHWMDRAAVLSTLDRMIVPGGGIACLSRNDSFFSHLDTRWGDIVQDVLQELLGAGWDYSGRMQHGKGTSHEEIFPLSPFSEVTEQTFTVREILTVDEIIGLQLSTSYAAPALLAEKHDAFCSLMTRRLLACESSGRFPDESVIHLHMAHRPGRA